jgi:translation elongation factor EF-G
MLRTNPIRRSFSTEEKKSILYAPAPAGYERETVLSYGEAEQQFKQLVAEEQSGGKETTWTIFKRYGSVPFAAALAVTLVQNEIVALNEELFLAGNFAVAMGAIYLKGSGAIKEWYEDSLNQAKKKQEDWDQLSIDVMENNIQELQVSMHAPEVYREYQKEYSEAAKALMAYEYARPRHEARAAMLKRLAEIKSMEDERVKSERKDLADKSIQNFRAKWTANPALRASIVDQAIANLGKKPVLDYNTDPIVGIFNEYLKSAGRQALKP